MNRFAAVVALLALAACTQSDQPTAGAARLASQAQGVQPEATGATFVAARTQRIKQAGAFAGLPDRGELLAYADRDSTKHEGAYTWHRAGVSEAYALRAIVDRKLRVVTPSGEILDIEYDHHVEHESGDWSWVGHLPGDPGAQTILTFGAEAVFGSIAQVGKRSLRLTSRDGAAWLVETDPAKLAGLASAGANPDKPDHLAVPKQLLAGQAGIAPVEGQAAPVTAAAAAAATTIDVLVGYTGGIASRPGGASAALTRINNLVTVTNQAFANSQVNAHIRLVHAMPVTYTEASTNESTLEQLTGYDVSEQRFITPSPAFNALRAAREQYGADLVVLMRAFRDPEQDGCGIAWLVGGGKAGITPGDEQDYFGYSVVGDGQDRNEQDGQTYFCRDESFAHELAHNMGSAHDREAAKGDDGVLDHPDDYGAFTFSFGLKTGPTTGNFYTIMAYGDAGQTDYRVFSNPRIRFCGGRPCGSTTYEDNARSLGALASAVASFRSARSSVRHDVDGNGLSDRLFRETTPAPAFSYHMTQVSAGIVYPMGLSWRVVATGDFNGDGYLDLVWGADSTRALSLWLGDRYRRYTTRVSLGNYGLGWSVAGAGDIDGDGRSDLLLRYYKTARNNFSYWIMNGATRTRIGYLSLGASWRIVATGDFNADGRLDLVWGADSTRALVMWIGNGSSFSSYSLGTYGLGWSVAGAGDIDGDGRSDLLLRYYKTASNNFSYWVMNGPTRTRIGYDSLGASWKVATTGNFNRDNRLDIIWVAGDGSTLIWYSNGSSFTKYPFETLRSGKTYINI